MPHRWTGWWDDIPSHHNALDFGTEARAIVALAGGVAAIDSRARAALPDNPRLATRMADWALYGAPGDPLALRLAVDVYMAKFRPMKYTFIGGEDRMLMKLIVVEATQVIVGCHVVGPDSPEMIQMAAIAIKMGVTKAQWDQTCAVHPTAAEELVTMRDKYVAPTAA